MAKVKSVEYEIMGNREKFDIKVNSKGDFLIDIPERLVNILEFGTNRSNRIINTTLNGVEKQLADAIVKFKNTKVTVDLFIEIQYKASGIYIRNKDGIAMFQPSRSRYNATGYDNTPTLGFGFEILIKATIDEVVTWYDTAKWEGQPGERHSIITGKPEMLNHGDIIPTHRRSPFDEPKSGIIPYTETAEKQLLRIQEELRKISETLFTLVELEPVELERAILNTLLIEAR